MIYLGDNLEIMKGMDDESVDLIATDPPYNTGRDFGEYNDQWNDDEYSVWSDISKIRDKHPEAGYFISSMMHSSDRSTQCFFAFLGIRLYEMKRILKPTGSIFVQCDDHTDGYLRVLMDFIFGGFNRRNTITWKRFSGGNGATTKFRRCSDRILYYARSPEHSFNPQYTPLTPEHIESAYRFDDGDGKGRYCSSPLGAPVLGYMYSFEGYRTPSTGWRCPRETMERYKKENRLIYPRLIGGMLSRKLYLSESKGISVSDIWTDIGLGSIGEEASGYPTQKPVELYERIIISATKKGDTVFDPFCGSGTTLVAARKNFRKPIGCDRNPPAVRLAKSRLEEEESRPKKLSLFPETGEIE